MNIELIKSLIQEQGFARVPNVLDKNTLILLRQETEKFIQCMDNDVVQFDGVIEAVKYPILKSPQFLENLTNPIMITILNFLFESNLLFPVWEDIIVKQYQGSIVPIHQDLHPEIDYTKCRVLTCGIYLTENQQNPVYFLPQSHKLGEIKREEAVKVANSRFSDFVPIYAEAGDIIIHNSLTIHHSPKNISTSPRYTWYITFQSLPEALIGTTWNKEWIYSKRNYMYKSFQQRKFNELDLPILEFPDLGIIQANDEFTMTQKSRMYDD